MKWDVNYKVIPFAWLNVIFLQPQGYNKPQLLGKKIIYFQKSQSDNKDPKLNYQHHRRRTTTGDGRELMSWRWEWEVMGVKGGCKSKAIQPHHYYYYVPFHLRGSEKLPCFTKIWHQNIWQNESAWQVTNVFWQGWTGERERVMERERGW